MCYANFRSSRACMIVALASLCMSGCMAYPQNEQVIGAKDEAFECLGATVHPGERLAIQARDGSRWITIAETTTNTRPSVWDSGTWYIWHVPEATVPSRCWSYSGWVFDAAEIRVISLDDEILGDPALFTFEQGFDPWEYSDVYAAWEDYGHGRSLTILGYR